ncbi:MAG: copper chaperone [Bacteroidales bacterium]|jgi:copper chaperone|nr:copper chaperone [Bacteroidales bacterium]MDN5330134.1 copper chaperone [Bacteroidales bacterium]
MEIKQLKFKTNITCMHCLAKVTPVLNAIPEIDNWKVDLNTEDKILTVEGEISEEMIIDALQRVGYHAEGI